MYVAYIRVSICCRCASALSESQSSKGTLNDQLGHEPWHTHSNDLSTMTKSKQDVLLQIAAISPADICYEETLSTLRYAERYICGWVLSLGVLSWILLVASVQWAGGWGRGQKAEQNDLCERDMGGNKTNKRRQNWGRGPSNHPCSAQERSRGLLQAGAKPAVIGIRLPVFSCQRAWPFTYFSLIAWHTEGVWWQAGDVYANR